MIKFNVFPLFPEDAISTKKIIQAFSKVQRPFLNI